MSALFAPPALVGGDRSPWAVLAPSAQLGGASAALAVAAAWDRWRWWNSAASVPSHLSLKELRRVVERLRAEGIGVTVDAADQAPAGRPASEREDVDQWRLACRQPWGTALAVLDDASTAQPPP